MEVFTKRDSRPGRIAHEVAGLAWLADTPEGAAHVVPVLRSGKGWLEEAHLASVPTSARAAEDFGRALALTHAAGASHLGAPPPGLAGGGWMGEARLPLPATPEESTASWGAFWAEHRLAPYVDASALVPEARRLIERVLDRLASGELDHDQPRLVREAGVGAARLHGDLWSGNVMWTPEGAVLIDPAAQGGHAECDLACLAVFGCPHLERITAAYDEASPLADGWRERVGLHQLHILLVHSFLFGRAWVPDLLAAARPWV